MEIQLYTEQDTQYGGFSCSSLTRSFGIMAALWRVGLKHSHLSVISLITPAQAPGKPPNIHGCTDVQPWGPPGHTVRLFFQQSC